MTDNQKFNLSELIQTQENIISEMKAELTAFNTQDFVQQNNLLSEQNEKQQQAIADLTAKNQQLEADLQNSNEALKKQLFAEKLGVLEKTNKSIDIFFRDTVTNVSKLQTYENQVKSRISKMRQTLTQNAYPFTSEMEAELSKLEALMAQKIAEHNKLKEEEMAACKELYNNEYLKLKSEKPTPEEIEKAKKRKNLESFVGLNVFSKIGIVFLIIGVLAAGRYAYTQLNEMFKAVFMFAAGLGLTAAGEFLSFKKKTPLSLAFAGGGIGILYIASILSNVSLNIYSGTVAFVLCAVITALALFLSNRHQSQTICVLSSIGGYLPLLSLLFDTPSYSPADAVYISESEMFAKMFVGAGYLILLSASTMLTCFNKKWYPAQFIGFAFTSVSLVGLITHKNALVNMFFQNNTETIYSVIVSVVAIIIFAIYSALPIYKALSKNEKMFGTPDLALLISNTIVFFVCTFVNIAELSNIWKSVVFAILIALFTAIAVFIKRAMPQEEKSSVFFTVSTIFTAFVMPMHLDEFPFMVIVWIAEAFLLLLYTVFKKNKVYQISGYIIYTISVFGTLFISESNIVNFATEMLLLASTIALFILNFKAYKNDFLSKCFAVFSIAYFSIMITNYMPGFIDLYSMLEPEVYEVLIVLITAIRIILAFAFIVFVTAKLTTYKPILIEGLIINTILLVYNANFFNQINLFYNNELYYAFEHMAKPVQAVLLFGSVILSTLMMLNIRSVVAKLLVQNYVQLKSSDTETVKSAFTVVTVLTFLYTLTGALINNFTIDFDNPVISIIYIAVAALAIIYGFVKKTPIVRIFGLIFTIVSLGKLFLFDLSTATEGLRIISYFAFGIITILISAIYQNQSKKLNS